MSYKDPPVCRASNICSVGVSPKIAKLNLTIEVVARGEMTTRSDNKKRDIKEIKPQKKSGVPEYSSCLI